MANRVGLGAKMTITDRKGQRYSRCESCGRIGPEGEECPDRACVSRFMLAPDNSVSFAAPKTSRTVAGTAIAKATARPATDAGRWRYGVEMRREGSRWYPQKPAPHYPAPQPYVYRKQPQSLAWTHDDKWRRRVPDEYAAWLAERDAPKPQPEAEPMPEPEVSSSVVPFVPALVSTPTPAREETKPHA